VLVRDRSTGYLWAYRGNGTSLGTRFRVATGMNALTAITRLGDFDRDGREDLIARDAATGNLWLYPGRSTSLAPRVRIAGAGWNAMREITAVRDLDKDGFPDVLAVQASTGCLYFYAGRGNQLMTGRRLGCGWIGYDELTGIGDLNRDGHPDLVARHIGTGTLRLFRGTTGGLLAGTQIGGTGWGKMRSLAGIGDLDRDGYPDLFAVEASTGHLYRYRGSSSGLMTGRLVGAGWKSTLQPIL
jgi:hypothetical protein